MSASSAARQYSSDLLALENVCGVMSATKVKGGVDTGKPCITVIVTKKGDVAHPVPKEINGVPTDVVEDDPQWCAHDWPVHCGDDIGIAESGHHGTLGLIYYIPPMLYGMTCGHIIKGDIGVGVTHPGGTGRWYKNLDGSMGNHAEFGNLVARVMPESGLDAAAIGLDPGEDPSYPDEGAGMPWTSICSFLDTFHWQLRVHPYKPGIPLANFPVYAKRVRNKLRGAGLWVRGLSTVERGDTVRFSGARSGLRDGTVVSTDAIVQTRYGTQSVIMRDMIVVRTQAAQGDSGALLINAKAQGVGMVTMAATWAYCQPIQRCLQALHGPLEGYDICR